MKQHKLMQNKLYSCILALFLLVCGTFLACLARPLAASAETVKMQTIRVGYFYLPGYHEIDEQGYRRGYGYDFLQRLKFYNNWKCEYLGYNESWANGYKMLERGEIDLMTGVVRRPERLEKFSYSTNPIGRTSTSLFVRETDTRFAPGYYQTYNGIVIGALRNGVSTAQFFRFAKEKGFHYKLIYFNHMSDLLEALREKKTVDAIVTLGTRYMEHERILDQFSSEYIYAIVKKGNEGLLDHINRAMYKMEFVNPIWRQELFAKYYMPRKGRILPLYEDEDAYRADFNAERELLVLVNPDRRPYSYYEEGKLKGIFPKIMQELSHRSGLKYKFLPVKNREEYLNALTHQQADLVLDMPKLNHQAERLGYNLSEPLLSPTLFMLKLRDNNEQPQSVALTKSAYDYGQKPDYVPEEAKLYRLNSLKDCVDGVLEGKYDATYAYALQAQDALAQDVRKKLKMTLVHFSQFDYCIGVKADENYLLASIINKGVASVKANYIDELIGEYTEQQVAPPLWLEIVNDPWAVAIIVFVVLGNIFLVLMLFMRRKNIKIISQKNQQLQEQHKLLRRALEQAQESSKAKSVFLNSMSHDIRTPMNAIMGFAKLAEEQSDNDATKGYLQKIMLAGKNLLTLVNDVLNMSSIDNGKLQVHEESFELTEMLHGLVDMLQPLAKAKQLQLSLDITKLSKRQVLCDRALLERVLTNCLSNALQYTNKGGTVRLIAEQKGAALEQQAMYRFQIQDTGIGMSQEFLQHLFEPFARERDTTTSGIQGTGLGMTIVKSILDLLGGSIKVTSEEGKGTTVDIQLCLGLAPEPEPKEDKPLESHGKRVLVVDDVELNREIAQIMLEEAGFEVECCTNGREAVDFMAQAEQGSIDFILMDLLMPVMDGIEAAKQIRALPNKAIAQTTIIALTANEMHETQQEVLEAGMNAMLNKPFNVEALLKTLKELPAKEEH